MQLFIDTGDVEETRKAWAMGLVDGVTTNPTLIAKSGRNYEEVVRELCDFVGGPVSAQVFATGHDGMMEEARRWAKVHPNVVVKVPMTAEGLRALRSCVREGIRVNVTLCFSAAQALLVGRAGATFVSPFVGRLDDIAEPGTDVIEKIVRIYRNYHFSTKVLVASVRLPTQVVQAALLGADVCTCPFAVLQRLLDHPLTDVGLQRFTADATKIPGRRP
jgi:transaldolase